MFRKNPWPEIKSFATTSWLLFILNRNPTFDRIAAWNPDSEAVSDFTFHLGLQLGLAKANCVFMSSRENVRDAFMMVFLGPLRAFLGSPFLDCVTNAPL
ncbi:hypothetical protein YC2023_015874 [Brassica napus]